MSALDSLRCRSPAEGNASKNLKDSEGEDTGEDRPRMWEVWIETRFQEPVHRADRLSPYGSVA